MTQRLFTPLSVPENQNLRSSPNTVNYGKNPMFDFATGEFLLNSDGTFVIRDDKAGLTNLIRKALVTERGYYPIYSLNYGSELKYLIGARLTVEEKKLEVERMIRDALKPEARVTSITDFETEISNDYVQVSFRYEDIFGNSQRIDVTY
jgi:hypothetical protein